MDLIKELLSEIQWPVLCRRSVHMMIMASSDLKVSDSSSLFRSTEKIEAKKIFAPGDLCL